MQQRYAVTVRAKTKLLFTFRLIPVISAMLAKQGIDAAPLLADAGLPPDALRGEITAPLPRIRAFIDAAAAACKARLFGIMLAESLQGGVYGVAEFLVRSAPSVEEGLRSLCEFGGLINPSGTFRLVDGTLHYAIGSERDALGTHLNEMTIAYIVRNLRSIVDNAALTEVWFPHGREEGTAEVAAWFGCQVRYKAPDCGFALSRESLALAPRSADPLLFTFLGQQARAQLARLGPVDIVSQLVRVLETRLSTGELDFNGIARALATTPRSLQRHLAEAGTSYRDVLSHVRRRRRAELLGGGVGETEVAHQLGFSDARAMRRSLDDDN